MLKLRILEVQYTYPIARNIRLEKKIAIFNLYSHSYLTGFFSCVNDYIEFNNIILQG